MVMHLKFVRELSDEKNFNNEEVASIAGKEQSVRSSIANKKKVNTSNNYLRLSEPGSDTEEPILKQRLINKSLLKKSFANVKDNRGNCAMEQSEFLKR